MTDPGLEGEFLELLPHTVPPATRELATEARRTVPAEAPQHHLVERMRRLVSERYRYLAPGQEGAARNLREFASGVAGGHCEYFATALALMLRSEGVPARLVTGYRSLEWNDESTELTIRERHAHAWVEVLDPEAGWYAVDGTPAVDEAAEAAGGLFAGIRAFVSTLWEHVAGFNQKDRERVLAWLLAAPGRIAGAPAVPVAVLVAAVAAAAALRWRRRRRRPAAILAYARSVARAGLEALPGETPRELERLSELEAATSAHERLRYRGGYETARCDVRAAPRAG
jgi:hypothetical protein